MTLSLPGIDACDSIKTAVTMKLFTMILSWLPLKKEYSDSDAFSKGQTPDTYVSLCNRLPSPGLVGIEGNGNDEDKKNAKIYLNAIAAMSGEWATGLLDRGECV